MPPNAIGAKRKLNSAATSSASTACTSRADKIAAVQDWPTPRTTRHIRQFLGLTNYFLGYIERYAEIAAPLSALQGIKSALEWTVKQQKAFDSLKAAITSAPVLATFNPDHPIYIHTDSSGYTILGWLGQTDNGKPLPMPLQPTEYELWRNFPSFVRYSSFRAKCMEPKPDTRCMNKNF
ncbi:hypothetical protein PhCBS80983_g06414 [Powellomyces hirtus]|uniref:Reverse transcriptase/retrotransposon-derived protein RNase H-like domain-containing protein n=1 Tax=Powellomyces hirtus TaxID=109895 RepID=A0A507DML6_9FUNG|nr:hypothetical protein PhCBS80983_g06414 [Powellomyces hirtus]